VLNQNACHCLPHRRKEAAVLPRQHLPVRRKRQRTITVNRIRERRTETSVAVQPNAESAIKELSHSREDLG
jgi:hypothetical protein